MEPLFKSRIKQPLLAALVAVSPGLALAGPAPLFAPHASELQSTITPYGPLIRVGRDNVRAEPYGQGGPAPAGAAPSVSAPPSQSTESTVDVVRQARVDVRTTATIVQRIDDGGEFCRVLSVARRADCVAESLERSALGLSNSGEEGEVKRALTSAASELRQIVSQNVNTAQPATTPRVTQNGRTRVASRPIREVQPDRVAAVNAQAEAVLDELSTTLLRSAENSERRQVSYTLIAEAVDSNKVLLRS